MSNYGVIGSILYVLVVLVLLVIVFGSVILFGSWSATTLLHLNGLVWWAYFITFICVCGGLIGANINIGRD